MDIFRICRTCLNESDDNLISIYSHVTTKEEYLSTSDLHNFENTLAEEKTQINSILNELTGNQYNSTEYPYPDKICETCLNDLKCAYKFKQRCENAFDELKKLPEENNIFDGHCNELESSEDENKPLTELIKKEKKPVVEYDNIDSTQEIAEIIFNEPEPDENVINEDDGDGNTEDDGDTVVKKKPKSHNCTVCNKFFTRQTHLRRHMITHSDERAFACKTCNKTFRRADHLKTHENYHANIKPFTCQHCQKTFSRTEHLRRHITNLHTEKPNSFKCTYCDYVAESTKLLNKHQKTHNKVFYVCKFCEQQFPTRPELNEHTKSHNNDVRPFLCSECGMRFIRNDYLVIHMRRHTGEKPFKCKYCERAFPRLTDLTVHERYHTNEKKHTCDLCGKGFQRAYNLSVHKRTHTGEKPYECPHCFRRFTQGNDLKAHVRRHTGERFPCDMCGSSFIQTYLLNNHKKNAHGIDTKSHISRVAKIDSTSHDTPVTAQIESFEQKNKAMSTEYTVDES